MTMSTLQPLLTDPAKRPETVAAFAEVVDQEVAGKRGLSGAAIRTAYKTVTRMGPSVVPNAVDQMLPGFVSALDPFWQDWSASGEGTFGDYLHRHGQEVAEALLAVTDARARSVDQKVLQRAYQGLRGAATGHVIAALPRLGARIEGLAS